MKTSETKTAPVQRESQAAAERSYPHDIGGNATAAEARPRFVAQARQIDTLFGRSAQRAMTTPTEQDAHPNRTGLPSQLKAGIESMSGLDLSNVRVHSNSNKPAQLNALAYAQGNDIHLGPGQQQHLPHEAWHVVQQMQGRVKPTLQAAGVPVNDDPALEQEADSMGARALNSANRASAENRNNSIYQRRVVGQVDASNYSRSPEILQMKRLGYVPAIPGNFRATTTLAFDNSGVPDHDKAFNNSQRPNVYTNNVNNGGGAAPILAGGTHPRSDVGGTALIDRNVVSPIEPEIDHIVPRGDGGANDFDNARVISKTQNTNGNVPRPAAAGRALRAYEAFNIGPTGGPLVNVGAGALIPLPIATQLATYIGIGVPGVVGGFGNAALGQLAGAAPGSQNGITFN